MKLLKYLLWFLLILLVVGFLTGLWFFKLRSKERVYTEKLTYTFSLKKPRPLSQPKNSYARGALKSGLAYEKSLGTNPFKFGFIGSTDGHNSAGVTDENNYFGKIGLNDPTPESRLAEIPYGNLSPKLKSAAGLAGVWALH